MSNNVKTIRDLIKAKVDEAGSLQGTFDFETGDNTGYPFATVSPADGESEFGDSAGKQGGRNIQTMRYDIKIYQEREKHQFGQEKAENVALGVLDELLTAFHQDTTLSGAVLWQRPINWNADYEILNSIVRTMNIQIQVVKDINTN